jgi:hypothetical protein
MFWCENDTIYFPQNDKTTLKKNENEKNLDAHLAVDWKMQ